MGMPTGSLRDPARPILIASREEPHAERVRVSETASRSARRTNVLPIWTRPGWFLQDSTMLDWTDRPPLATFDLHGQTVLEAATNAERFLRAQARARPGAVVRLITGRGRGGSGAPVRTRIRSLLRALKESGGVVRDFLLEDTEGSYLVRLWG